MVPLLRRLSVVGILGVLLSVQGLPVAAETGDQEKEQARLLKEAQARAKQAEALTKALTAEVQRLRAEVAQLQALIKSRDDAIIKLTKDSQEQRERAVAAEAVANAALHRSISMLKALQEKELTVIRPAKPGEVPNLNPPAQYIKGTILSVSAADKTKVDISLGKDHGLAAGHTLEVYRLKPRPEYLGRLRVLAVQERSGSAQLLKSATTHSDLKAGDEVASTIPR